MKNIRSMDNPSNDKYWEILFKTQFENLQGFIYSKWIDGFKKLKLDDTKVPSIEYVNDQLAKYCNWKIEPTNKEFDPGDVWTASLAKQVLRVSNFVRTPEELYYCDQPDFWHDIFGHTPFLFDQEYTKMYTRLGKLSVKYREEKNERKLKLIHQINWYIPEVGIISEDGKLKAFGATQYSSSGELERSLVKKNNLIELNFKNLLEVENADRTKLQDVYFVFDSISQVEELIDQVEEI